MPIEEPLDRLLDGTYQSDLLHILEAEALEREADRRPGLMFGDVEVNRQVERAAVEHVTRLYEHEGWVTLSVESGRQGYDLLARRADEERHLEVKGARGGALDFILTARERERAEHDPDFVCAVVTRALSAEPQLTEIPGSRLFEGGAFEVVAYRVKGSTSVRVQSS
jgi:hypothetical protein